MIHLQMLVSEQRGIGTTVQDWSPQCKDRDRGLAEALAWSGGEGKGPTVEGD